ncbi:uncharacterized protein LOC105913995 [Setaria italica]|uniref:uncharacterized protein LOC105913995 n=1 Tax=Setaria italica TaxID=4555 RepID=UPI000645AE91|nr:uncharacterized protein LOC105913995 [Setaria italica]
MTMATVVVTIATPTIVTIVTTTATTAIAMTRLQPCEDPLYGIVLGKGSYPIGRVVLPDTFGMPGNYRMEHLTFEVANFKTFYHAIFGRPMLARFMVIPHHTYLVLKMPAPNGVLSIHGNIETSYKCDTEAV